MSTLFPKSISYETHTAGITEGSYNAAGDWVAGSSETLTLLGSVQPASGEEIESLPVGRRNRGVSKIYSDRALPIAEEGGGEAGAIVFWQGDKWEVVKEGKYKNDLIPHYKYAFVALHCITIVLLFFNDYSIKMT